MDTINSTSAVVSTSSYCTDWSSHTHTQHHIIDTNSLRILRARQLSLLRREGGSYESNEQGHGLHPSTGIFTATGRRIPRPLSIDVRQAICVAPLNTNSCPRLTQRIQYSRWTRQQQKYRPFGGVAEKGENIGVGLLLRPRYCLLAAYMLLCITLHCTHNLFIWNILVSVSVVVVCYYSIVLQWNWILLATTHFTCFVP